MAVFNLAELPTAERFHLMTRVVAPRPIAFVSSLDAQGQGNLAPFSYFNIGGSNPASCVICPILNRQGEPKDTLLNIRETGEYTISIVSRTMAKRMNQASWTYPRAVDEFDETGFSRAKSKLVKPPWVAESPVGIECRMYQIVEHGSGALSGSFIIGEMLYMHIADEVLTDGLPDNAKLEQVSRLGASYYSSITLDNLFEMQRPTQG